MASYKSDATALLAEQIDKESNVTTPAGEELEIGDDSVKEIEGEVDVVVDTDNQLDTPPVAVE